MQARFRGWWVLMAAVGLDANLPHLSLQAERRPGQAYAAAQFLNAVLQGNFRVAYGQMAPEVRQTISLSRFEAQARSIWKSGQRHGKAIELYKLGMRLEEQNRSRLFYTFSFAADSSLKTPSELLEVTFRDTAARAVLSFALRNGTVPVKKPALPPTMQKHRRK